MRALGRKSPPAEHRKVVKLDLVRHLAITLPPIPEAVDLTFPWPPLYLGHNDEVGDCGAAGMANGLSTEARREGRKTAFDGMPAIDDLIRSVYFQYTGGIDDGVVLLDFMRWVQEHGFLGEKIGEPIAINPKSPDQVALAIGLGYGIYVGAEMTQASVSGAGGEFWRTDDGDQTVVGGHCMFASGWLKNGSYGQPNVSLESWGMKFYATWDWWEKQVDEAYILVDLARPVSAFNLEELRADVAQLQAS